MTQRLGSARMLVLYGMTVGGEGSVDMHTLCKGLLGGSPEHTQH